MKLFLAESKKILIKQYALFLFVLVIIARLFSASSETRQDFGFFSSADKERYLETILPLSGYLDDEKEETLVAMLEGYYEAEAARKQLSAQLTSGEITFEEYLAAMEPYSAAIENRDVTERLYEQYEYAAGDKERRALIPTKSVPVMEKVSVNYLFLLCIAFCAAFSQMIEQTSKTDIILRTTPRGGSKTACAKALSMLLLTALVSVILSLVDFYVLGKQLPAEYFGYNIHSLNNFKNSFSDMSIIGVFVSTQALKCLGALFVAACGMLIARFSGSYPASIFPLAAIPIVADYLSERDSQSYFLPTGLLKGYGYFYGDVTEEGYEEYVYFHSVPEWYFWTLVIFTVLFIATAVFILIRSGRNRLNKKRAVTSAAAIISVISLICFTGCSARSSEPLKFYGGRLGGDWVKDDGTIENTRCVFKPEYTMEDENAEFLTVKIKYTDKESGEDGYLPFDVFSKDIYALQLFLTENYLFYLESQNGAGQSLVRVDLSDWSRETLYTSQFTANKVMFGLLFESAEGVPSDFHNVFSDEKNVYLSHPNYGIFRLKANGKLSHIVEDSVSGGVAYDIENFYYITDGNVLNKYNISSKKTERLAEDVLQFSLRFEGETLVYETEKGEESIKL